MQTPPPAFPFACRRCGACCRQPGSVRVAPDEVEALARHLGLTPHEFTAAFTRLRPDRAGLELTETPKGACVFLQPDGCRVHAAKPRQCRTYPSAWRIPGDDRFCAARRPAQADG